MYRGTYKINNHVIQKLDTNQHTHNRNLNGPNESVMTPKEIGVPELDKFIDRYLNIYI